jgi:hypothetical protein
LSLIGVLALGVGIIIACVGSPTLWQNHFSYQSSGSGVASKADPDDAVTGSSITPIVLLQRDTLLEDLSDSLAQTGIKGWNLGRLQDAVQVTHASDSNRIDVQVQTPEKTVTQKIAKLLNQSYMQSFQDLQKEILQREIAFTQNRLKNTQDKLINGDGYMKSLLATGMQQLEPAFSNDPLLGEKSLSERYETLNQQLKQSEKEIAYEETRSKSYSKLLNKDEKTLMQGVILGGDPTIEKIDNELQAVETDADIVSVKYSPDLSEKEEKAAKIKSLQHLLDRQSQKVLGDEFRTPVIRDSFRKQLLADLIASKVNLVAAKSQYASLSSERDDLLKHLDQVADKLGDYNAWTLQKNMLQETASSLEKRLADLNYQLKNSVLPLELLHGIPKEPLPIENWSQRMVLGLSSFLALFLLFGSLPYLVDYQSFKMSHQTLPNIFQALLARHGQEIIIMLPMSSAGHLNASLQLGGMLNQFGRETLVIDADLSHRWLSQKVAPNPSQGVLEHLLSPELKQSIQDPLSGAHILPLETTIQPDRVVEFSQIVQRLPKVWSRWPGSVVILDLAHWHEAYHSLLPSVSQVIFYSSPSEKANTLFPRVFKSKYRVPVSIVEV